MVSRIIPRVGPVGPRFEIDDEPCYVRFELDGDQRASGFDEFERRLKDGDDRVLIYVPVLFGRFWDPLAQ
ncbi:hypothetical protein C497_11148 [Halalkalicoccus jeotgali B3]|uniref:Uncharacterized protein n=1 Tax=Halalkalicoccus jeotgali (strain DSM 18796 / CECT 7217 / JCM 14584 / KCTC 4019 / B3) TaxID=795797 RepID=D8J5I7_HALJB|nr:hypothetical protein HacjB3_11500 [Halalkalicoccus jeotgali B3]ELY36547.1 hypothetical protein C497_11148 [Halalkalicoccus jeotgali B3]